MTDKFIRSCGVTCSCRRITLEYILAEARDELLGTIVVIKRFIGFIWEIIVIISEFMNLSPSGQNRVILPNTAYQFIYGIVMLISEFINVRVSD